MASMADLYFRLSGGAANTSPAAALGGALSTAGGGRVLSQTATGLTTLTGVAIDDASGNAIGAGQLFFDQSAGSLRWTPYGGAAGTPVVVSGGSGRYAIYGGGGAGALYVTVTVGSLPSGDITNTVTIANIANNVWDDVSKADALAGDTEYRGLYVKNEHASADMVSGKLWVSENTPGQDNIQIALGIEAVSVALATIANENTAPATVDFAANNPISKATGLSLPDLAAAAYKGFWVRRTVPAGVTEAETANTFRLGVSVYI